MRVLASLWFAVVLLTVCTAGFCIQLLLFIIAFPFDRRRAVAGRFYRLMAVTVAWLTPQWRFRIHGPLPEPRPRKTVLVSNHVSNSDPFLVSLLPWEMKWLGKAKLFWIPFIGWSMFLAGDVRVVRGDRASAKAAMDHCKRHLARGMPVMIFPEGTRSRTGELLPFKDGAFRLAIEAGADVLPMAIAGTRTALPKHSGLIGFSCAHVTVGEPISTQGMGPDDVPALKDLARARVEALYQTIALLSEQTSINS